MVAAVSESTSAGTGINLAGTLREPGLLLALPCAA